MDSKYSQYVISQSQFRVRIKKDQADHVFIAYYFHSAEGQKRLLANKCHVGVPALAQATTNFRQIDIPLPELRNQKKIAAILATLDSKVAVNRKIASELESMAQDLYHYWFTQFDFPDEQGRPYKSSGGKMLWNERLRREVPVGWEVSKLGNVLNQVIDHRGKTPAKLGGDWVENGITALSVKHVKDGRLIDLEKTNRVSKEIFDRWMPEKLQSGDILMTSEAPLGEFYFICSNVEYCLSQRLFAMRANKNAILPVYLYYELSRGNGLSQIMGKQSGSTVFGIRQNELREILVLVPILLVQKQFEKVTAPIRNQIASLDAESRELASLRDFLLPLLMNGQVRV